MADLKLGDNFIDNMMYSNSQIDKIYLGDIEVWSAIPADVKTHIARVIADGGTVPEQAKMVSMVKKLIAANLWNNCVFFGLPLGGVKKDNNQFISKVYDLKSNADIAESTGTRQPKYQLDGSMLYDGGDRLQTATLPVGNVIRNVVNNFTVCTSFSNISTSVVAQAFFGRATTDTNRVFLVYKASSADGFGASKFKVALYDTSGGFMRFRYSNSTPTLNTKHSAIVTYNGTDIDIMLNGVADNGIYDPNYNTTGNIANVDCAVSVGDWAMATTAPLINGCVNMAMIFNKVLTAQEKVIVNEILSDWS